MAGPAPSLEQRLDAIESRQAIADLVHRYARHIRCDQPDMVAALFTAEGTFEIRDGDPDRSEYTVRSRYDGREDIHAHMSANQGKPHPLPLLHNHIITVDGDAASGNAVMEAGIYGGTHKIIGEYLDTYRRLGGEWLFAARIYTIFGGASSL